MHALSFDIDSVITGTSRLTDAQAMELYHNASLHDLWRSHRAGRSGYADGEHPFRHQGSADINTYKMFVEAARALLRDGGYLGFITPSGIYTDKGSTELRKLLLERSRLLGRKAKGPPWR